MVGAAIRPNRVRWDRSDHRASDDSAEPMDANEPIESTETAEPADPIDRIDPADPIESTDPFEPIDRSESCDQSDHFDPFDAMPRVLQGPAGPGMASECGFDGSQMETLRR